MKKRILFDVKRLAIAAMLTAMSVVIGIFCKTVLNFADGLFRVTFENLPIILSGVMLGPVIGALVGAASDLISYLLSPQTYPPNLIVTLGAALIGLISGLVSRFVVKKRGAMQFAVAGTVAHLVGSVIVKSAGLYQFYGMLVLWRIPLYMLIIPIEVLLLTLLYKSPAVRKLVDREASRPSEKSAPVSQKEDNSMTYDEAIAFIHSVSNAFCKPGLERVTALLDRLGHPEEGLRFIHVAGTNGKGSTSAMLDSVLRAAGLKVGLYTSPYIVEFGERIRVDGKNIEKANLAAIASRIKPICDSLEDKPTEFEVITAIAMEYFKAEKVDVVVLECGLGGRFDATNVIRNPLISIITGIALDHTAILGDTIEKIAHEKAGIIKDGAPVVFGGTDDAARAVIRSTAEERGSDYIEVDYDRLDVKEYTLDGTTLDFGNHRDIKIPLLGRYQPRNTALVLTALDLLGSRGITVGEDAVRKGLAAVAWPARFEVISRDPLVIYDGAHNPEGIRAAVDSIKEYFADKKLIAVSGVLRDKDYDYIAKTLSEVMYKVYTIKADNPRALTAEEYAEVLRGYGVDAVPMPSIGEAVEAAYEEARMSATPLVSLGSLYTYADVVRKIKEMKN